MQDVLVNGNDTVLTEEAITFNIIYVGNTVEILLPFIKTLLINSECKYRLVSNACSEREEQILKRFADTNSRVSFFRLQTHKILPHHEVLHQLLEIEKSDCFAFMDSDIVATGPFLSALLERLKNNLAVFTGLPLWHDRDEMSMPKDFNIMGGRFVHSHHNILLGLSYAAIYKTEPLLQFMSTSGIDFRKYQWHEIEFKYQKQLIELELDKTLYDTAKLLNILWQQHNANMTFYNSEDLIHLGGVSGPSARPKRAFYRSALSKILPLHLIHFLKCVFSDAPGMNYKERLNLGRLIQKRRLSERIAFEYLNGTKTGIHNFDVSFLSNELLAKIEAGLKEVNEATEPHKLNQSFNV